MSLLFLKSSFIPSIVKREVRANHSNGAPDISETLTGVQARTRFPTALCCAITMYLAVCAITNGGTNALRQLLCTHMCITAMQQNLNEPYSFPIKTGRLGTPVLLSFKLLGQLQ